ncbi:hypothetical protein GW7_20646 [Heterocephalus glaber]|uniref:Uncharacterized protein n=1 Tax=Heterocephalus glaber TaxID=10181 RepID=G5B6M4_HETGA|nr:hypothetical protein GW7_20646 [Heterocephalus glaber]
MCHFIYHGTFSAKSLCSEQKPDLQPESFMFLFTSLSTPEPSDPESKGCVPRCPPVWGLLQIQESQFLSQQDWGPQRTSEEMKCLQNVCMRLREALSTTQADNLALGEKLQNLPSCLYEKLKEEMQAWQEEVKDTQEEALAGQVVGSYSGKG